MRCVGDIAVSSEAMYYIEQCHQHVANLVPATKSRTNSTEGATNVSNMLMSARDIERELTA